MTLQHDEIQSWWDSRPPRDRRGNLRAIQRKDGKVAHLYRYYLKGKIQPAINFSHKWTLKEVQAVVAKIEAKIHEEEVAERMGFAMPGGARIKSPTLMELIEWHIRDAMLKNKPRTIKNYEAAFSDFMDFIGDTSALADLLELKKMHEYRAHLREKVSELTASNRIKLVRAVFANAKRKQQLAVDPFRDYRGELVPPSEERDILTAREMSHIADMIKAEKKAHWARVYLAWQIARYTGMRGADILRLKFENINWEKRTLSFPMAKRRDLIITLPIRSSLFIILEKLKGKRGKIFYFENFVWTDQILSKRFRYYIRKLRGKFKGAGSHTPRHSFNQILLDNDIAYDYRCFLLGQATPGEQAKYIHKKQQSHIEKLRAIVESLPLD